MPTSKWLTILIVCLIYSFIMPPVEKALKKRFAKKWQYYAISFLIGFVIIFTLYILADLLPFVSSQ